MSLNLETLEQSLCVSCGKSLSEAILVPIKSGVGTLLACSECVAKFGHAALGGEADRLIAAAVAAGPERNSWLTCRHCGEPMKRNPLHPFWCDRCEEMRKNIALAASLSPGG